MIRFILALVLALIATPAFAQTAVRATAEFHRVEWDQPAASVADAQSFAYRFVIDGVPSVAPMLPVTCGGAASPFACSAPFPAVAPGARSISVVASVTVDGKQLASDPSPAVAVVVVVKPAAPSKTRIVISN